MFSTIFFILVTCVVASLGYALWVNRDLMKERLYHQWLSLRILRGSETAKFATEFYDTHVRPLLRRRTIALDLAAISLAIIASIVLLPLFR